MKFELRYVLPEGQWQMINIMCDRRIRMMLPLQVLKTERGTCNVAAFVGTAATTTSSVIADR